MLVTVTWQISLASRNLISRVKLSRLEPPATSVELEDYFREVVNKELARLVQAPIRDSGFKIKRRKG